jgi:hypothetical protein
MVRKWRKIKKFEKMSDGGPSKAGVSEILLMEINPFFEALLRKHIVCSLFLKGTR